MKTVATDMGMRVDDFDGFVDTLNNQGYLLKKGARVFQLQTTNF
jgi:DNA helicase MCM8